MKKQNVRTLSLIVCSFTYLLIGAAVFDALESESEGEDKLSLYRNKNFIMEKYNITKHDWDNITHLVIKLKPHNANQWKFSGAFFYAMTVFTTVGYGHSTPRTKSGKLFTIAYAMIGIPLGLVMFQVTEWNLVVIVTGVAIMVVGFGTLVFAEKEGWNYLDSFYYIMITLTTIGFGDFVALQTGDELETEPGYVAFTIVFILFAMTVLSANINLLVLRFMTMNTEDERREELEAAAAALTAARLERGDTAAGGGSTAALALNGGMAITRQPLFSSISNLRRGSFTSQHSSLLAQPPAPVELPPSPPASQKSVASVCTCHCSNPLKIWRRRRQMRQRYAVTRGAGKFETAGIKYNEVGLCVVHEKVNDGQGKPKTCANISLYKKKPRSFVENSKDPAEEDQEEMSGVGAASVAVLAVLAAVL